MNATRFASSEGARETAAVPARSVRAMLLQLAYNLHATHVVAVLPAQPERRPVRRRVVTPRATAVRSA